ncbi:subunit 1 of condensin complex [Chloropicon primus]|uniref:Subunit 1 of condensin complex n=1 Tax=Chloropicon primus TaxID=1764295 RepID=A0A5B8MWK0_9CHLO|nr:subunit 1 of condensin complex [Chloropicon primus]|eukprot:QDZ24827.1 subunit 1 of condensin complex [Chloropicon primus]
MALKVPLELVELERKQYGMDLRKERGEEVDGLASQLVKELCENEATCLAHEVGEDKGEGVLSRTLTVVKHFKEVGRDNKVRVADCLGSNLSVLNATIDATTADIKQRKAGASKKGQDDQVEEDLKTLRVALKLHVCFLDCVLREATAFGKANPETAKAKKGSGAAGRSKTSGQNWEWLFAIEKVLRPLACSSGLDLHTLFDGNQLETEQLLHKFSGTALLALNCNPCLGSGQSGSSIKESLMRLLAYTCHKMMLLDSATHSGALPAAVAEAEEAKEEEEGQESEEGAEKSAEADEMNNHVAADSKLDALLPAFVDTINKQEAASSVLVDAAIYASQALGNSSFGKELVNELAKVDPRDYKLQQQSDAQGVKNVASFFIDMAERLPQVMTSCLSMIVPHLGGEAYNLRSGIVTVISRILVHHSSNGGAAAHAPTGSETFLKSKQHFLKILVERVFDVSAFTRSKTLQSWSYLCQHKAIPIGYWNYIAEIAIGRLEDKAALVRKSAMQLLSTMLQYNPFAPCLPVTKFELSLQEYQEKLESAKKEKKSPKEDEGGEQAQESEEAAANGEDGKDEDEGADPELASLRALVASLDAAVKFCRHLTSSIDVITQLLASSSITDATEAISFIVLLCQFQIQGADGAARKILPLIFSHEQTVKDAVIDGFAQLYVRERMDALATVLSKLVISLNVGEMASLQSIFKELWSKKILDHSLVDDLLRMLPSSETDVYTLQGGLHLFSLIALEDSDVVVDNLKTIIEAGFGRAARRNPYIYRSACNILTNLPKGSFVLKNESPVFGKIVQIIAGRDEHIPSLQWYSVAEACISALYSLNSNPETSACTILRFMSTLMTDENGVLSVKSTSRFLFAAGQIAVKHLVHIESLGSKVRQRNQTKGGKDEEKDDIADQIGAGAAAADAALDTLLDETEKEILYSNNIVSLCGPLLHVLCTDSDLMQSHIQLRVAATLALTKLMCLDAKYCEQNLPILFSMLANKSNETEIRSNIVIALGDLVYRFPNKLEPWTKHIYQVLEDQDTKVRKHALMVLSHLILNDMLKVKGHVSRIARLLLDSDKRTASFAELFFHELSRKTATTVYNLIPDILSNLSNDASLEEEGFRYIMQHILAFIQRDKQTDGLIEKLCHRFDACGENRINCNIAFCISQLNVTEKGLKRLSENFKHYKHVFENEEVVAYFQLILAKAKKVVANKQNLKAAADDLESKIQTVVTESSEADAENGGAEEGADDAKPDNVGAKAEAENQASAGSTEKHHKSEPTTVQETETKPARALRSSSRFNKKTTA